MAHYQFFVKPLNGLANKAINEIPEVIFFDEIKNLYQLPDKKTLCTLLKQQRELRGTGGRAGKQPMDFLSYRRLGVNGEIKQLTDKQIEDLLSTQLKLKPKHLQPASKIMPAKA